MTEKGNLVNWLIGRHNVLHPTDFHFQAFLDDIVGITQMQAIEKVVPFQVELSPNPLADLLARRRTDEKISYQVLLNFLATRQIYQESQVTLRIFSECPCLGVLVERLLIENSKLMPWQYLRFEVSDRGIKAFTQRFLEKAITTLVARYLVARYLYWEGSL